MNEGLGKRKFLDSDNLVLPDAIEKQIETINRTACLTSIQKRNPFFNNVVRSQRLSGKEKNKLYPTN